MKDLYLMRHGETLFNRRALIQGVVNSPLMDEGVAQALHTRKEYFEKENIVFDYACCSPQNRAVQTIELVTSMPFERITDLHEMCFGKLEGCPAYLGCSEEEFDTYYGTIGGETVEQVQKRMNHALLGVMEYPSHKSVLAVAHGCANQAFALYWKPYSRLAKEPLLNNCSVLHFLYDEERKVFILQDVFNEDYHTEDLEKIRAMHKGLYFPQDGVNDFYALATPETVAPKEEKIA